MLTLLMPLGAALQAAPDPIGTVALASPPPAEADPSGQLAATLRSGTDGPGGTNLPFVVDDTGDTMTGDLAFTGDSGVQFPGGVLSGDPVLTYGLAAVCLASASIPGCAEGDITAVNAGTGLLGGGTSGDVTLRADTAFLQRRVAGVCAPGSALRSIAPEGTVACETDDDTLFTNGTGLLLAGTTFSVDTAAIQKRVSGVCAPGSSIRVITGEGAVTCEADNDSAHTAGSGLALTGLQFRVQDCADGQILKTVGTAWACGNDDGGTAFTAGAGLALTGGTFRVRDCATEQVLESGGPGSWSCVSPAATNTTGALVRRDGSGNFAANTITAALNGNAATATALAANGANCAAGQFAAGVSAAGAAEGCAGAVTSVAAGTGLTGGPITSTGTLSIATGGVTSALLADGTVGSADVNTSQVQVRVNGTCANGSALDSVLASGLVTCEPVWRRGGNLGTAPGTDFLGTRDEVPFEVRVGNRRVLRLEPQSVVMESPNVLLGIAQNSVATGVGGATIGGGGEVFQENRVSDSFGTIGGGTGNQVGDDDDVFDDSTEPVSGTIGGGTRNRVSGREATVAGGLQNIATGNFTAIGGGFVNRATGIQATVAGGVSNIASGIGSTIGGGSNNAASGLRATVPGGFLNQASGNHSLAAGIRANAVHNGTLVWADDQGSDFTSTADRQFLLRAQNGVGINTASPLGHLHVAGNDSEGRLMVTAKASSNTDAFVDLAEDVQASSSIRIKYDGSANRLEIGGQTTVTRGPWLNMSRDTGLFGLGRVSSGNRLEVEGGASKTTAGDWLANSDARIKTDVRSLGGALATLDQLRPVAFRYTPEYIAAHPSIEDKVYYNVIAQEYAQVFPDYVQDSGEGGILQVDTYPAQVHALAAIQELNHLMREKERHIDALEARLARLEARLNVAAEPLPAKVPFTPPAAKVVAVEPVLKPVTWSAEAVLVNGAAVVDFPPAFAKALSSAAPVQVRLDPVGNTGPLVVEGQERTHVVVQGLDGGDGPFRITVQGMTDAP